MKIKILSSVLFTLSLQLSLAQYKGPCPSISGTALDGSKVVIPASNQKFTIFGIASSQKAETALRTWYQPAYSFFIEKTKGPIPADEYDVNLYFIPVFTGLAQAASGKIEAKMKDGMQKEFHPNVVVFSGNFDELKAKLKIEDKDQPYFFLVNSKGEVVYSTKGAYTDEKLEEITNILDQ
jgi:hypothetical protein